MYGCTPATAAVPYMHIHHTTPPRHAIRPYLTSRRRYRKPLLRRERANGQQVLVVRKRQIHLVEAKRPASHPPNPNPNPATPANFPSRPPIPSRRDPAPRTRSPLWALRRVYPNATTAGAASWWWWRCRCWGCGGGGVRGRQEGRGRRGPRSAGCGRELVVVVVMLLLLLLLILLACVVVVVGVDDVGVVLVLVSFARPVHERGWHKGRQKHVTQEANGKCGRS